MALIWSPAHMATFAKVVDLNGFTAAARALKVPKAAVSRAIAELERELGVKVLTRTTRRIHLTPAGEQLLPHCRTILEAAEQVRQRSAELTEQRSGPLKVLAETTYGRVLLSPLVPRFLERFPSIPLEVELGEATDGDPSSAADALRSLATSDGNVLLFNVQLSAKEASPIEFPAQPDQLPDKHARLMFELSSALTPYMRTVAQQEGYAVGEGSRGFVFNADMVSVIKFLDIGTRPSNLR